MNKGDILLIRYRFNPIRWLIRKITKSKWDECAWSINHFKLIRVRFGKIRGVSFRHYWDNKLYKIKLVQIKGLTKKNIKEVMEPAIDKIYKPTKLSMAGIIAKCLDDIDICFRKDKNPEEITPQEIDDASISENISNQI